MLLGYQNSKEIKIPVNTLKKHVLVLGSSGSGKTVLSKILIEELILNNVPSVIIDPQGDISSLCLDGNKDDIVKYTLSKRKSDFDKKKNIKIYTPNSDSGIKLSLNPFGENINELSYSLTKLLGYNLNNDGGKIAQTAIYTTLEKNEINSFEELIKNLNTDILTDKELKLLKRKLKLLTLGDKKNLFEGMQLNIKDIKNQTSIIYLNSLNSQEEKEFLISTIANKIYTYMLKNPSEKLQLVFYIDEISSFLPAGNKLTSCKPILNLLYKQARKYGIGCIATTQNPGDIDYKAFSQFSTWFLGKLTAKQDRDKIKTSLKNLSDEDLITKISSLKTSNFLLINPDLFNTPIIFKTRYLLTQHTTLTENDLSKISPKKDKELNKIPEQTNTIKHLPLNLKEENLNEIIEQKYKRKFKFFGAKTETLNSYSLILYPLIKTKIKQYNKKLFGKNEIKEYSLIFDGLTSEPLVFKNGSPYSFKGLNKLQHLSETEIIILKELKKEQTSYELATKLKLTPNFISEILRKLQTKKLVSHNKENSKSYLWYPLITINIPKKINKLNNKINTNSKLSKKIVNPKTKIDNLAKFINSYYNNCELIEDEIIYLPIWKIELSGNKDQRELFINGFNSKEFFPLTDL